MENHTPGDAVSHGECPGVRLPGARPANTSPGQHHPTAELHETTAERAPEVGRKAPHTSGKTKLRAGPGVSERRVGVQLRVAGSAENTAGITQDWHERGQDFPSKAGPSHTHPPCPPPTPALPQRRSKEPACWLTKDSINQIPDP